MPSSRASDDVAPPDAAAPEQADLGEQLARTEDRLKRALADLDNYRKRAAREIERQVDESRDGLVGDWLEVVDSVERALRMERPGESAHDGLRAVLDQMEAILARQGVHRIGEAGERFDPERHDAVAVRPAEGVEDQTVLEVARSGYALDHRVLRPAQVVVARRPEHGA
jgi:molecular chaperone GrpE